MDYAIEHDEEARRFHVDVGGLESELVYRLSDRVMRIVHTGVPMPLEGQGIASALVKAALATARREGWKVVPACSYAAAFFQRHHEYDDLLA
ncbi:GNAT family N-acetyltransferase [Arenimonas sp.]|uniref:GNAT family N-acetyltransferase n=1 Tax=Arenimonas sp. TaxID=1872635 RepID=UPI0039E4AC26